ncbi:SRPBCC family protein [Hamadaea sp. NPDC050747]|uniref:SRPBCC family protein n=1 Tax=Hamadaea sp. NPDC050747 TaxID=3155789 RepID=UPI0033FFB45C
MTSKLIATSSVSIPADPTAVWDALTDPATVSQAFFGADVTTDWEPGSPIRFDGDWQGREFHDHGEILDAEPGQYLRFTHFSPLSGLPDEPDNYHVVTFDLVPVGDETAVTITQTNAGSEEEVRHSEQMWGDVLAVLRDSVGRPGE